MAEPRKIRAPIPTAYNGLGRLETSPETSKISSSLILVSLRKNVFEFIKLDAIIEASNKEGCIRDMRSFVDWGFLEPKTDKDVLNNE